MGRSAMETKGPEGERETATPILDASSKSGYLLYHGQYDSYAYCVNTDLKYSAILVESRKRPAWNRKYHPVFSCSTYTQSV